MHSGVVTWLFRHRLKSKVPSYQVAAPISTANCTTNFVALKLRYTPIVVINTTNNYAGMLSTV